MHVMTLEAEIQPKTKANKLHNMPKSVTRLQQERFEELTRLLRLGLGGITWEAIKESRKDDENRYAIYS